MSMAHQETLVLGGIGLVLLALLLLTVWGSRRNQVKNTLFLPLLFGVVVCGALMVVTAHGGVLTGR